MARPNNSIKAIANASTGVVSEIIPHRITDGVYLGELPSISGDKKAVVFSGDEYSFPPTPEEDDTYTLITDIRDGIVTYLYVIK